MEIWKEGSMFIAYIPQLDLSSCGKTVEQARKNIREATEAFLEETQEMGTLTEILEEAGFTFEKEWKAPEPVSFEKMSLSI